jgi:thiosulfate dehydrogenase [quinone] large subunit
MRRSALVSGRAGSIAESWSRQSWPLRILRGFLGGTFVYAGVQKLADPNFLRSGTPDFIGTQLRSFATGTPLRPILVALDRIPDLTGVGIALAETAVGLCTLLGVAAVAAAATGLAINLALFLSATWHVHPYFLGSDSAYAVAWAAYLAGEVEIRRRAVRALAGHGSRRQRAGAPTGLGRREFLRGAAVGLGTVVLAVGAAALGRASPSAAGTLLAPSASPTLRGRHPGSGSSRGPSAPGGTPVATLDSIPVGSAKAFNDPVQGPSVLVRLGKNDVVAYSRVCTHAGCLVQYDQQARLLVCPCHGAEFDPARQAEPVAGPAPTALAPISVAIDRATGTVLAQD